MFAFPYLKPNTSYIRGPGDKEIPVARFNQYGMLVYGTAIISFLAMVISNMTMDSYKVETVSIVSKPIDGQNCTILGAYTGQLPKPQSSLSDTDLEILANCLFDPKLSTGSFVPGPILNSENPPYLQPQCPKSQSDYNTGPTIFDTYPYSSCKADTAVNKDLVKAAMEKFHSFGCGALMELYGGGGGGTSSWSLTSFMLRLNPSAKSMYYPSKENCLSSLKLDSVQMNRVDKPGALLSSSIVPFPTSSTNCAVTLSTGQMVYQFSNPDLKNGELIDQTSNLLMNLVCSAGKSSLGYPIVSSCGIPSPTVCPTFTSEKMVEFFNLLYPTFASDICSVYDSFPPYQCIKNVPPTFLSALGSSLAITNTLLTVLFLLTTYMLRNGYDYLDSVLGKAVDSGASSTAGKGDTATSKKEVEMGIDVKTKTDTGEMVSNPMKPNQPNPIQSNPI